MCSSAPSKSSSSATDGATLTLSKTRSSLTASSTRHLAVVRYLIPFDPRVDVTPTTKQRKTTAAGTFHDQDFDDSECDDDVEQPSSAASACRSNAVRRAPRSLFLAERYKPKWKPVNGVRDVGCQNPLDQCRKIGNQILHACYTNAVDAKRAGPVKLTAEPIGNSPHRGWRIVMQIPADATCSPETVAMHFYKTDPVAQAQHYTSIKVIGIPQVKASPHPNAGDVIVLGVILYDPDVLHQEPVFPGQRKPFPSDNPNNEKHCKTGVPMIAPLRGQLIAVNYYTSLNEKQCLVFGATEKPELRTIDPDYIGEHGEGMKYGIISLTRHDRGRVHITTGSTVWEFFFAYPKEWRQTAFQNLADSSSQRELHLRVRNLPRPWGDVTVTQLFGVNASSEFVPTHYRLLAPWPSTETKDDLSIDVSPASFICRLGDDEKSRRSAGVRTIRIGRQTAGQIYCRGFYVTTTTAYKCAVDFANVALTSERTAIDEAFEHQAARMAAAWDYAVAHNDVAKDFYYHLLEQEDPGACIDIAAASERVSLPSAERLLQHFKAVETIGLRDLPPLPISRSESDRMVHAVRQVLRHRPVVVPDSLWTLLRRHKLVRTPEEELKFSFDALLQSPSVELQSVAQLSTMELIGQRIQQLIPDRNVRLEWRWPNPAHLYIVIRSVKMNANRLDAGVDVKGEFDETFVINGHVLDDELRTACFPKQKSASAIVIEHMLAQNLVSVTVLSEQVDRLLQQPLPSIVPVVEAESPLGDTNDDVPAAHVLPVKHNSRKRPTTNHDNDSVTVNSLLRKELTRLESKYSLLERRYDVTQMQYDELHAQYTALQSQHRALVQQLHGVIAGVADANASATAPVIAQSPTGVARLSPVVARLSPVVAALTKRRHVKSEMSDAAAATGASGADAALNKRRRITVEPESCESTPSSPN